MIQTGFHVTGPTRVLARDHCAAFEYGTVTLCGSAFHRILLAFEISGLFPFRSPLLRESLLLSFPMVT